MSPSFQRLSIIACLHFASELKYEVSEMMLLDLVKSIMSVRVRFLISLAKIQINSEVTKFYNVKYSFPDKRTSIYDCFWTTAILLPLFLFPFALGEGRGTPPCDDFNVLTMTSEPIMLFQNLHSSGKRCNFTRKCLAING